MTTSLARPGFVVFLGIALGLLAWAADHVSSDSALPLAAGLGNLPSHWLAAAFLMGVVSRHQPTGAIWAALGLAIAVVVYYLAISVAGDRPGADLSGAARAWLLVAVAAGPVFGFAGATWIVGRPGQRPLAVALLAGALIGEALYIFDELDVAAAGPVSDPASTFATLELCVASVLPFIMLTRIRDRLLALSSAILFGIVFYFAIAAVIDAVRQALSPF